MRKINPKQHSAEHILASVFNELFKARITDTRFKDKKVRCDFHLNLNSPLEEVIQKAEEETNKIIAKNLPVTYEEGKREKLVDKYSLHRVPKEIKNIRLVKIGEEIVTPCRGEHVSNTNEIGKIKIRTFNQIKPDVIRLTFVLEN